MTAPRRTPQGSCLKVASYNIHRGIGADRQFRPERVATVIEELDADILGLQEVDWRHEAIEGETQFGYFAHRPGFTAIPGPNIRDHRGHYGNLLLSRLPVREVRRVDLSVGAYEPRGAIDADLEVGGTLLRVIVTHLGLRVRERRRQSHRLREIIEEAPARPTLLLGDFNEWLPANPTLRPLAALCATTAMPRSWPSPRPLLALDRILCSAVYDLSRVRVHGSRLARKASDHLPVTATVRLADLDA